MFQLFCVNPNSIIIDTLILQPTTYCARQCSGCYVKTNTSPRQETLSLFTWTNLVQLFANPDIHNYSANQISISADDMPETGREKTYMSILIGCILEAIKEHRELPEVHMTMHSPTTLNSYLESGLSLEKFKRLNNLSFSNIPVITDEMKELKESGVSISLSKMFYGGPLNKTQEIEKVKEFVDYIYLILPKGKFMQYTALEYKKGILDVIVSQFPEIKDKFVYDTCFGPCNANITKFMVWPDGSVSGCPYLKTSNKKGENLAEILDNIVEAKHKLDLISCPII